MPKQIIPSQAYIYLIIGGIFLICLGIFKLLLHFEPSHKTKVQVPLEESIKKQSIIFQRLYTNAKQIFPEFTDNNHTKLSHSLGGTQGKNHALKLIISEKELNNATFQSVYLSRYSNNNWIIKEQGNKYVLIQNITNNKSCVSKISQNNLTFWQIEFQSPDGLCDIS